MPRSKVPVQCRYCGKEKSKSNIRRHEKDFCSKRERKDNELEKRSHNTRAVSCDGQDLLLKDKNSYEGSLSQSPGSDQISNYGEFDIDKTYNVQSCQNKKQDHLEETKLNEKEPMVWAQRNFSNFQNKPAKIQMASAPQFIEQNLGPQQKMQMHPTNTYTMSAQTALFSDHFQPMDIENVKAGDCVSFLYRAARLNKINNLELFSHLEFFTTPKVIEFISKTKPTILKQTLSEQSAADLTVEHLRGLIASLLAYDDFEAIKILTQLISACEKTKVETAFNGMQQTLTILLGSNELAQWFISNYKYVDDQALCFLRQLKNSNTTHGATIMQCQRGFKCQSDQIQFTTDLLQRSLSVPGQFVLFREVIDQSLTLYPIQHQVSFDDFSKCIIKLLAAKEDISLGKHKIKDWIRVCEEYGSGKILRNDSSITLMLQKFASDNKIGPTVPIQYFNGQIKSYLQSLIDKTGVTLTNEQLAVVTAALSTINIKPKQHWELTAGTGKSFIIAAIAAASMSQEANKMIEIIVPSVYLMNRDKKRFQQLWSIFGSTRISYNTDMSQKNIDDETMENTLTIIDEADDLMLSNPIKFFLSIEQRKNVLMFSGSFKDKDDAFLPIIFKNFKITAWDCAFVQSCITQLSFHSDVIAANLDNYINIEREKNAVIVYTQVDKLVHYAQFPEPVYQLQTTQNDSLLKLNGPSYEEYQGQNVRGQINDDLTQSDQTTIVQESIDVMNQINQTAANQAAGPQFTILIDKKVNSTYPLVIVTDEKNLRGIDIRAPRNGITFISERSFSNQRAMQQALGRVGRFNDRCKRISVEGVPEFDSQGELKSFSSIVQMAVQLSTNKSNKYAKKRSSKQRNGFKPVDNPEDKTQGKLKFETRINKN